MSIWDRFAAGLAKSRLALTRGLQSLTSRTGFEPVSLDDLEAALIAADVGVKMADRLLDEVRRGLSAGELTGSEDVRRRLKTLMTSYFDDAPPSTLAAGASPLVILFVGVNGVGKTTTVAKLADRYRAEGKRVMLAAGDTFRAGAIEQLQVWGTRLGIEVIRQSAGSDPAAVVFDAVNAANARRADILLVDSAGRLHTKQSLVEEVLKVKRVIGKALPGAPHEVLLVLDATTGYNALAQARVFHQALGVTGIVVTKLDGTAKGGIVLAILEELRLPVKFLGLGEDLDALVPFEPELFVEGLLGSEDWERQTA